MDKLTKGIERAITSALPNTSEHTERRQDINSARFEARAAFLTHIGKIREFVAGQLNSIDTLHKNIAAIHEEEKMRLAELLKSGATPQPASTGWAQVATKKPKATAPAKRAAVQIVQGVSLPAVRVPTFADVRGDGELYYVETANHFAFMLGGQLFHGNIGAILQENTEQHHTIDCRYGKNCVVPNCNFYHDPIISGTKDVRNYHVGQFIYRPPTDRRGMRTFGSVEHLAADLNGESSGNVSSNRDRAVHELLCAMVLSKHFS
jgi:hypothetical protein